jgi:hypothetical protein
MTPTGRCWSSTTGSPVKVKESEIMDKLDDGTGKGASLPTNFFTGEDLNDFVL